MNSIWDRLGAAMGIAFVALFTIGAANVFAVEGPESPAEADEIVAFFTENISSFRLGLTLMLLGAAALLWFSGSVWRALRNAEPDGRLSAIALGSGVLTAGFYLASVGMLGSYLTVRWEEMDPLVTQSLFEAGGFAFAFVFLGGTLLRAAFAGAASLAAIRFGGLPKWLGWIGLLVALANLVGSFVLFEGAEEGIIGNIAFFSFILGFSVWILLTSIYLMIKPGGGAAPAAQAGP